MDDFVVEYRTFHNADPPKILRLWHASNLGPSAAEGFPCDVLELFVFSQPFFDRRGCILAIEDERVIGFVHAGFSASRAGDALDFEKGVIAALVVHPDFRRRGIATELIRRAEGYLAGKGAKEVTAGGGADGNGFYVGIYGGLEPSGFAESAAPWSQLFERLGYQARPPVVVLHRDLNKGRDPVSSRLLRHRRRLNLVITDRIPGLNWWWYTRFGHLDAIQFELRDRVSNEAVAMGQIIGLDVYVPKWGVRAVGMRQIYVPEPYRRQGYGLSLVLEITRRLRDQSVQLIEAQVGTENEPAMALFREALFEPMQQLVAFRRILSAD
ncbi:MAG: GNAT family N-acetyltransferase [Planctomycetaceae bacterium]